MPRGVSYLSTARLAHLRAQSPIAARVAAQRHRERAREKWSRLVAQCRDKWAVWPMAYAAGYKAGASAGERRGFAKGYEQALRDMRRSA